MENTTRSTSWARCWRDERQKDIDRANDAAHGRGIPPAAGQRLVLSLQWVQPVLSRKEDLDRAVRGAAAESLPGAVDRRAAGTTRDGGRPVPAATRRRGLRLPHRAGLWRAPGSPVRLSHLSARLDGRRQWSGMVR